MTRARAALLHLTISVLTGIAAVVLMFGFWYPPPYSFAAGADRLALLLIGVDVGIGPLLTFIVFKPGKWGLKFDLCVIAALQVAALSYGLHTVAVSRPVFLVAAVDRFELVAANEISDADLAQGREARFRRLSWQGPELVYGELPTDPDELSQLQSSELAGRDLKNLPRYFRDYADNAGQMLQRARSLERIYESNPSARPTLENWLRVRKLAASEVVWLPLSAQHKDLTVLLDARSGRVLDTVDIRPPWG